MKNIFVIFLGFVFMVLGILSILGNVASSEGGPSNLVGNYMDKGDGTFRVDLNWMAFGSIQEIHRESVPPTGGTFISYIGGTSSYTYYNVPAGTYEYKICSSGCVSFSNTITLVLGSASPESPPAGSVPPDPTGLTATLANSGVDVVLSWTDNSTNEEYFEIKRRDNSGTWFLLYSSTINQVSYVDAGLPTGSYEYKVRACNSAYGCSAYSGLASINIASAGDEGSATLSNTKTISGTVFYPNGTLVFDAQVVAYQASTGKWIPGLTDNLGFYDIKVSGGSWEVKVEPDPNVTSIDWSYNEGNKNTFFENDNLAEQKTLNFTVSLSDATITGTVLKPGGTPPAPNTVWVNFSSSNGGSSYGNPILVDGSFSVSVPEGSYSGYIYSNDYTLSSQDLNPITVNKGETKNIGTIILSSQMDHIKGIVNNQNGNGVSGVKVSAQRSDDGGWTDTTTNSLGVYDLLVSPGTWKVQVELSSSSELYNPNPLQIVEVISGTIATVNFSLLSKDVTVSGTVVNEAGNIISDLYGQITVLKGFDGSVSLGGGNIEAGKFSFAASTGVYTLGLSLASNSKYTPGDSRVVNLVSGNNVVTMKAFENISVITGYLKNESGNIIKGQKAKVFASAGGGIWQSTAVSSTGEYRLKVSAGIWHWKYEIDSSTGFLPLNNQTISVSILAGQTIIQDIIVRKAGASIKGYVKDANGRGVAGIYVAASETGFRTADESSEFKDPTVSDTNTDSTGAYILVVPAGNYYIKTFVSHSTGWLAAPEQSVSAVDGQTANLDFSLRRPSAKIRGTVYRNLKPVASAFIWAWSETGGFQTAETDSNGKYEILVISNEEWSVNASKNVSGYLYRSEETSVFVGDSDISRVLEITKKGKLPDSQIQITEATKIITVKIGDGATVTAPANSMSTTGNVSISITPDTRVISQGDTKVVGFAYELIARDSVGKVITNFNSEVTITLPYTDEDLLGLGVAEDDLTLGFWDEAVGAWKIKESFVVNKNDNVVTGTTDHFTRFALLTVISSVDTSGIVDGDLIKTADNPDVFIAKKVGNKKFKRLILNPDIFNAYGHLSWGNIKTVTQGQLDVFVLAGLTVEIYPDGIPVNGNVYQISSEPGSDVGISRWINMEASEFEATGYDWDSIYKINEFEASPDFYPAGNPITYTV